MDSETAKYKITGLVDIFDEQGVITGQYPIGSVQELTVERGTAAVENGAAELVEDEDADDADLGGADDDINNDPTGETGEVDVE